jgi:nucleoside-diphosphate-sugar epimerase
MRRIAVTGANGFVGRHMVRGAVAAGWSAVGIVRSNAAADQVARDGGRPVVIVGRDPDALAGALEGCEALVHLAQIGAERSGNTYTAVNIGSTQRVLQEADRAGVPRIVYFSGLGVARYGISRRSTNAYFLSKLAAETALMRSGLDCVVFRPSFIVGPGDAFVRTVVPALERGDFERPGDGSYRMQPIAVTDAVALVLTAVSRPAGSFPIVFDLVGPEAVSYARLLERLVAVAGACGRRLALRVREVAIEEADRRARDGGYQGLLPDELDCLLCDEVADPAPLVALLGRPLVELDAALAAALAAR